MTITTLQRAARGQGIGSSDAAAILGYSPWQSPEDVRLIKLGLVEPEETQSELAEIGTALEGGIADLAARRLNCKLVKPKGTYIHTSGLIRANVDRQVEKAAKGQPIVEVKDSGLDDGWGNEDLYGVPPYVLIQVCIQMLVVETDRAHVARLGRGWKRGMSMFEIPRDETIDRLIKGAEEKLLAWWDRHIVQGLPADADAAPASWDILKRVRRDPGVMISLPDGEIADWLSKKEAAKLAEKQADVAERRIIGLLSDAGAVSGECSRGVFTYAEQSANRIDTARLKAEAPEIAAKFTKESTYRVPRFKAAK